LWDWKRDRDDKEARLKKGEGWKGKGRKKCRSKKRGVHR
jgi:hypothetical protein